MNGGEFSSGSFSPRVDKRSRESGEKPFPTHKTNMSDIIEILEGKGATFDCFITSPGRCETAPTSGDDMHNSFMTYMTERTEENYKKVTLPLNAPK
jgi:hypothetical protein